MRNTDPLVVTEKLKASNRADWVTSAEESLDGRLLDSLATVTDDGISIAPIYASDDFDDEEQPVGIPSWIPSTIGITANSSIRISWDIRALIADADPETANNTVLDELERGATSLLVDPYAVGITTSSDLHKVLEDVHLDMAGVWLLPGPEAKETARWLLDLWKQKDINASNRLGGLGIDPLGVSIRYGVDPEFDSELFDLVDSVSDSPAVQAVTIDATPYAEAGATAASELAFSLATGVSYLRFFTENGLELEAILNTLAFTYSADTDQFITIAKLRAARRLWARVAEVCGANPAQRMQSQHVITSGSLLAKYSPSVNLLRNTVAAFAAGAGGAQAITVRPFDSAAGRPDEFGRRTARNTQLLLMEESGIAQVIDPTSGSWYVENLTNRLAEKAWEIFQSIEVDGGMAVAIAKGSITEKVDASWAAKKANLIDKKVELVGVEPGSVSNEKPLDRFPGPTIPSGSLPLRRFPAVFESVDGISVTNEEEQS